jgi:UDP-2,3-diacylglucosamine hydrolase
MPSTTPRCAQLDAASHWGVVDFISDLHLQAGEAATFDAWVRYLHDTPADAVFMLGDLFEVWVGDDAADEPGAFEARCTEVLHSAAQHRALYFMHGNRDFLVGRRFLDRAGVALLDDPTVLHFGGQRWLLSHGDALCLDDVDYLRFRAQVRSADWQQQFLAQPLPARRAVARQIRDASESRKQSGTPYADVDADAARAWLQAAQAPTLIHGHTHHPARHALGVDSADQPLQRLVLSDWDLAATPPRADLLRLDAQGRLQRLPIT